MTSIYDTYGTQPREDLKRNFDAETIRRDIAYGERDIKDISQFITEARSQLAIIEQTKFKRYISVQKGHDYGLKKVDFSVSVYRVPQVPGNERLRVYEHGDDSRRFVGNDRRKEFITFVRDRMAKYPDAERIGNAAGMIKPEKEVVQL